MSKLYSALFMVAAIAAPVALHADSISGTISAGGNDMFTTTATPNTITFTSGFVLGGPGANTGNFSILTDLNPIAFRPGPLPYKIGENVVPPAISPVQLFTTSEAGETFTFFLTNYNAQVVTNAPGCMSTLGSATCLDVTGNGYFTEMGTVNYTSSPGTFTFTSQKVGTQTSTSFSASAIAAPAPVPEPSSLVLLGTGILGVAGIVRRRIS